MIHTTSRVLTSGLRTHLDQTVTVSGWVNALRLQRKMQFVILRDHSGMAVHVIVVPSTLAWAQAMGRAFGIRWPSIRPVPRTV